MSAKVFRIGYTAQSTVRAYINTVTEALSVAAKTAAIDLLIPNNKFTVP